MSNDAAHRRHRHNRPVTGAIHPLVYAALIGFAAWFALAIWSFAGDGYTAYLLVVVSGFILMAFGLPLILSLVTRADEKPHEHHYRGPSFGDWAAGDVETWQGRRTGGSAATEILLPLAVAAFGMSIFGLVYHLAASSVA